MTLYGFCFAPPQGAIFCILYSQARALEVIPQDLTQGRSWQLIYDVLQNPAITKNIDQNITDKHIFTNNFLLIFVKGWKQ